MIRTAIHRTAAASFSLVVLALAASRAATAQAPGDGALFDLEAARSVAEEFPSVVPQAPVIPATQASYEEPAPFNPSTPREPISDQQLMQAGLELTDRFDEYEPNTDEEFDEAAQDASFDDSVSHSRNSLKGFLLGCIGCLGTLLALKWLGGSFTNSPPVDEDDASATDSTQANRQAAGQASTATVASEPALAAPRRRKRGRKRAHAAPPAQVMSVHPGWPTPVTVATAYPIASPVPVPVPVAVPQAMAPIGYLPYPHQSTYPPQTYLPPPHTNHYAPAPHSEPPSAPQPAPQPALQSAPRPATKSDSVQSDSYAANGAHESRQKPPRRPRRSAPPQSVAQKLVRQQVADDELTRHESTQPESASPPLVRRPSTPQQFSQPAPAQPAPGPSVPTQVVPDQYAPTQPVAVQHITPPQAVSLRVAAPPDNDSSEAAQSPTTRMTVDVAPVAGPTIATERSPHVAAAPSARHAGDLFARILEENRQVQVALDVADL